MIIIRNKFEILSAQKSVNLAKKINCIDALNNCGNLANYSIFGKNQKNNKIIFLQKRTMLSLVRVISTRIGVNGLHDISGVHSRGMSSWRALKFPEGHPNYDPKGHYTAISDDDIKNNTPMPDWKFTHAKPAIGHPKDPKVIEIHEISKTDLKGLEKPQSIARRSGNSLRNQDLSTAERNPEFDAKLAEGKPMANALDELRKKI